MSFIIHCMFVAERKGFEPSIRLWRIHTFQACAFDHSATSLNLFTTFRFKGAVKEYFKAIQRKCYSCVTQAKHLPETSAKYQKKNNATK